MRTYTIYNAILIRSVNVNTAVDLYRIIFIVYTAIPLWQAKTCNVFEIMEVSFPKKAAAT